MVGNRLWRCQLSLATIIPNGLSCSIWNEFEHLTRSKRGYEEEKPLFRDFLGARPDGSQKYCLLKSDLAARFDSDREKYVVYTEAKIPYIESVLAKARGDRFID